MLPATSSTRILNPRFVSEMVSYADRVGGSNGDGVWRVLVTIVELIDPRQYIFQSPV